MNRKHWILLLSLLTLIALVFLASGLGYIQFQPARPLPNVQPSAIRIPVEMAEQIAQIPLWKLVLILGAFILNMILFFFLLTPEARKRLLRQAIRFATTAVVLYLVLRNYYARIAELNSNQDVQPNGAGGLPTVGGESPVFHPPQMTPWANFLASLGVLLALIILAWIGYRRWRRMVLLRSSRTLHEIAAIAQSSLNDLKAGRDWGDVIVQSYVRMGEVVGRTRGIHRADAMTAREFAERIRFTGLPEEPVLRLTRLFESVRYGAHTSNQVEINEAITCLNSILAACGVAG